MTGIYINEYDDYQDYVATNLKQFDDNLEIIQEQLRIEDSLLDILCYNKEEECLVIIELKNKIATTSVLGQAINYYHLVIESGIKEEIERQKGKSIKDKPKVLILANKFDEDLINTIEYIDGIDIKLYIFNNDIGKQEIVKDNYKNIRYNLQYIDKSKDKLFEKIRKEIEHYSKYYNKELRVIEKPKEIKFYIGRKNICNVKRGYDYYFIVKCEIDINLIIYCPVCSGYKFNKSGSVLEIRDIPTEIIKEIIKSV